MVTGVPALFFLVAVLFQTVVSVQYAQKLCRSEDDCDWDQCCVEASTRLPGFSGICSSPAQNGEECNPNPRDKTEDGRYRIACPCEDGLSCRSRQETFRGNEYYLHTCEP